MVGLHLPPSVAATDGPGAALEINAFMGPCAGILGPMIEQKAAPHS